MTRKTRPVHRDFRLVAAILAVLAVIIGPQAALIVTLAVTIAVIGVLSVLIIRRLAGNPVCLAPTAAFSGG